jgi:hypothetical protein
MRAFQSTYVGRNDFPKSLPEFLLRQWFTLNARDRRAGARLLQSSGALILSGWLRQRYTQADHSPVMLNLCWVDDRCN